jgi:hypothetical protein
LETTKHILTRFIPFKGIIPYTALLKIRTKADKKSVENELLFDFDYEIVESYKKEYLIRLQKKDMTLNGLSILNAFDDILMETGKALWKLELLIDEKGGLSELINKKEIRDIWKNKRQQIEETYKGNVVKEYLDAMQNTVYDDNLLTTSVESDLLVRFLFNKLYCGYQLEQPPEKEFNTWTQTTIEIKKPIEITINNYILYNFIGNSKLIVKEERTAEKTENGIIMHTSGQITDYGNIYESINLITGMRCDNIQIDTIIKGDYFLDENEILNRIDMKISLQCGTLFKKEIDLNIKLKQ